MAGMKKSKPVFAFLVALGVAASMGWPTDTQGQAAPKTTPGAPGMQGKLQVEGTIKSVDPSGRVLTLEDGTQLSIPPTVRIQREALKEGAKVKASYEERNGQKVVTTMEVRP